HASPPPPASSRPRASAPSRAQEPCAGLRRRRRPRIPRPAATGRACTRSRFASLLLLPGRRLGLALGRHRREEVVGIVGGALPVLGDPARRGLLVEHVEP